MEPFGEEDSQLPTTSSMKSSSEEPHVASRLSEPLNTSRLSGRIGPESPTITASQPNAANNASSVSDVDARETEGTWFLSVVYGRGRK